jgi:hypothetical protein
MEMNEDGLFICIAAPVQRMNSHTLTHSVIETTSEKISLIQEVRNQQTGLIILLHVGMYPTSSCYIKSDQVTFKIIRKLMALNKN